MEQGYKKIKDNEEKVCLKEEDYTKCKLDGFISSKKITCACGIF